VVDVVSVSVEEFRAKARAWFDRPLTREFPQFPNGERFWVIGSEPEMWDMRGPNPVRLFDPMIMAQAVPVAGPEFDFPFKFIPPPPRPMAQIVHDPPIGPSAGDLLQAVRDLAAEAGVEPDERAQ
jgi:hypothetical protein